MKFDQFCDLVSQAKKDHPIWFEMESDTLPKEEDVQHAEACLGFKIPHDYKDFLMTFGGGYFALSIIYSLDKESEFNLIEINNKYKKISSNNYLIFSDNGCGDFYAYKINEDGHNCDILFYDHEINEWSKTDIKNIFYYIVKFALKM